MLHELLVLPRELRLVIQHHQAAMLTTTELTMVILMLCMFLILKMPETFCFLQL